MLLIVFTFTVIVNQVDYLVAFIDVRDDFPVKVTLISVHVGADVLHCEHDRLLNLLKVFDLFDLVVGELILGCRQDALVAE